MSIPLFVIPIICGLLAQALKPFINQQWYATMSPDGKKLPRYGGMPSAHSAFAFSIATIIGVTDGIFSTTFIIAMALLVLILDDALRMRIFLSRHGQALRRLIQKLPAEERRSYPYLESRLGHKPLEVAAGGALGVIVSLLLLFFIP
ncbi:MAG: divergent PAP2 family protein [Candidatus Andersenbacteria bacterium]